jgi:predicted transcriptional regulator
MSNEATPVPTDALEDVGYLSRSRHRVVILDALTRGASTRRELEETTGASRATLDRIVNELEDRGWVVRNPNGDYETTPTGTHLVEQFRPFLESVAAIRRLGDAVAWLPTDELGIGLEHFSDADVRRPEHDDPVDTIDFMADLIRASSRFRVLSHLSPPEPLSTILHDRVVSGELTSEGVVTDECLDFLAERADRRERWRDILDAGSDLYLYSGSIPCNLWIFDETVLIKKSGPEPIDESYGVPIVTDNDAVRSWGHDLIDRYRADAVRVDAEAFSEAAVSTGEPSASE